MPATVQFTECPNVTALSGYARVTPLDGAPVVGWCEYQRIGEQDMVWVQTLGGRVEVFHLAHVVRLTRLTEEDARVMRTDCIDLETILHAVCLKFDVPAEVIRGPRRDSLVLLPRLIFYKLARELMPRPHNTFAAIGKFIERDHGSVLSGAATLDGWMASDRQVAGHYEELRRQLQQQQGTEELNT